MMKIDSPSRRAAVDLMLARGRLGRLAFVREMVFSFCAMQYFDRAVPSGSEVHPIVALLTIPTIWIFVSGLVRRGHDIGLPAWAPLIFSIVVASSALPLLATGEASSILVAMILSASPLALLLLVRGEPFANRWGPGPAPRSPSSSNQGSIEVVQ